MKSDKKSDKPAGRADKAAAKKSKKGGLSVNRANTPDRDEVREQTTHRQGHPK